MDVEAPSLGKEDNGNDSQVRENGHLEPVSPETSGEGFPYAPENFPNPGDNWRWRVGKRVAITGHYLDRYLYAPKSLKNVLQKKLQWGGFPSKLSVERFIKAEFPDADMDAFFESFSWKIPSKKFQLANDSAGTPNRNTSIAVPRKESPEPSSPDPDSGCKARNKTCTSLVSRLDEPALSLMPCDICCSEPGFCRDCCCILCSKTVDFSHGGYSFVRCEASIGEKDSICGHVAHLKCGIRAYMAGTVGGSIRLDAEFYCRRCDSRTEMVSHVMKSLETCKSIHSRDVVEEILNMGVSVLRGSQKSSAKLLLSSIYSALSKLEGGSSVEEIWRGDGSLAIPIPSNCSSPGLPMNSNGKPCPRVVAKKNSPDATEQKEDPLKLSDSFSSQTHCNKVEIETEIDGVLRALREAQESEYKTVEEQLHAQKEYLQNLYQQLEHEISELKQRGTSNDNTVLERSVTERKHQIQREHEKLSQMKEQVAKGFGRTLKEIIKEHSLEVD